MAVERNKGVIRKERLYAAMLTNSVNPITILRRLNKKANNFSRSSFKFNSLFSIDDFCGYENRTYKHK